MATHALIEHAMMEFSRSFVVTVLKLCTCAHIDHGHCTKFNRLCTNISNNIINIDRDKNSIPNYGHNTQISKCIFSCFQSYLSLHNRGQTVVA